MNKKIQVIILVLIVLIGIFIRFYNLRYNTGFDWDQEYCVAFPAKQIINKDYTLIGPSTGVGDMRIAPLFFYLNALTFWMFNMDPIAGAYLTSFLSVLVLIIGYFLYKKIFGSFTSFIFILLYTSSIYIIVFDRAVFNANLFPIASILFSGGLWLVLKDRKNLGWFLAGLGFFLGANSHFSAFLFIPISMIFVFLNKKLLNKSILIYLLFIILAIAPLIIFEFRHGYMLTKHSTSFLLNFTSNFNNIVIMIYRRVSIILETIGRLVIYQVEHWLQKLIGLFFFLALFLLRNQKEVKVFFKIYLIFIFTYLIAFSLYSRNTPDYYYIGLIPLTVVGFSLILKKIYQLIPSSLIFLLIYICVILIRSYSLISAKNPQSLGYKQEIIKSIKKHSLNNSVSIIFDMNLGHSYGYDYLLDYYDLKTLEQNESQDVYWISYPSTRMPIPPDIVFGDIALGLPSSSSKIFETKNISFYNGLFRLRIPKKWISLSCSDIDFDKYLITPNTLATCKKFEEEDIGFQVYNIPNCEINRLKNIKNLKISRNMQFHSVSKNEFQIESLKEMLIVSRLEENRCILINDLSYSENGFSKQLKEILETVKT